MTVKRIPKVMKRGMKFYPAFLDTDRELTDRERPFLQLRRLTGSERAWLREHAAEASERAQAEMDRLPENARAALSADDPDKEGSPHMLAIAAAMMRMEAVQEQAELYRVAMMMRGFKEDWRLVSDRFPEEPEGPSLPRDMERGETEEVLKGRVKLLLFLDEADLDRLLEEAGEFRTKHGGEGLSEEDAGN